MNKYLIPTLIIVVLTAVNIFLIARKSEYKNNRNKYLLIGVLTVILDIVFITCAVLLFYSKPSQDNTLGDARCIAFKKFESQEYKVVIIDKYYDMHRSLCPTLVFQDKEGNKTVNQEFNIDISPFYGYVQVGDTLIKLKNEIKIRVKNASIDASVTLDFGCPAYKTTVNQDNKTTANRDSLTKN